jgi:protocatechuate 3,4-dioxygenase beta subunit
MGRDDRQLNRRQALGALGAVSLSSLLAACGADDETATNEQAVTTSTGETATVEPKTQTPSNAAAEFDSAATCTVATEMTEGPFYFDVDRIRSDIREGRPGTLLKLGVRVRDAAACEPIENAIIDVWQCDAAGSYSGFNGAEGETYLRGAQVTNADGIAEFKTLYPGWYPGRTVHIHLKVHLDKQTVLTTQLFTNRDTDDAVFTKAPYSARTNRDTFNENDPIFDSSGEMTLAINDDDVRGVMTLDVQRA